MGKKLLYPSEILKAYSFEELFSKDEKEAKIMFREYCKLYHPDVDSSKLATKLFNHIMMIYNSKGSSVVTNGSTITSIVFKDRKTNKGFELHNPSEHSTELCSIYYTATKVALVYDVKHKKFYDNYIKSVNNLKYVNKDMEDSFSRYMPKILKTFETEDNKLVILLDKTSEVVPLKAIMNAYEKIGENIPERQAAWMMNRFYNLSCYFDFYDLAFNGFAINNIWVSPDMHSILLFNGFEYTTKVNDKMIGLPSEVYAVLPLTNKNTKMSSVITDLESIQQLGRKIFNNNKNTEHINQFLKRGIDEKETPLDLWEKYKKEMKKHFPKKEFVIWDNIPFNTK